MTYSIGFRAPSRSELIEDWTESLLESLADDDRYADPDLAEQANPGEITPAAIERLHAMVTERLLDREAFAAWFGRSSTTPKNGEIDWRPEQPVTAEEVRELVAEGAVLLRNPASRFSFIRHGAASLSLFVHGESVVCTGPAAAGLAERLCAERRMRLDPEAIASPPALGLLVELLNQGSLAFDPED